MKLPKPEPQYVNTEEKKGGLVIYISRDRIGDDNNDHGRSLMHSFLYTLTETAPQPTAVILINSAVRLAQAGSVALESLSLLHEQGVKILVCDKSIDKVEGGKNFAVGKASNMHAIVQALLNAEKIITP